MVTRKTKCVLYYRLHFLDLNTEEDVFESVTSGSISTLRYYANKMARTRHLMLVDFYEVLIFGDYIWLTKCVVIPKKRGENEYHQYYYEAASIWKPLDEFLGINSQTSTTVPHPDTTQTPQQN
jgi:hypothetical protein